MKEIKDFIASLERLDKAMDAETRVMTCAEAAFVLGRTPVTVSRYIAEGRLHKAVGNGITGVKAKEVYEMLVR